MKVVNMNRAARILLFRIIFNSSRFKSIPTCVRTETNMLQNMLVMTQKNVIVSKHSSINYIPVFSLLSLFMMEDMRLESFSSEPDGSGNNVLIWKKPSFSKSVIGVV